MKKAIQRLMLVALLGAFADGATGASTLSIRLVEASRSVAPSSADLGDVTEILQRNLPFASYTLQGTQNLPLPASQTVGLGGYTVACSGPAQELQVVVQRGGRVLISTVLRLQDGTPVIVGGFPSANGRLILVFVVR